MLANATRRFVGRLGLLLPALLLTGCENGAWHFGRKAPPPERAPRPLPAEDPVLAGTIGSVTYLASAEAQPVRGFGIVIGLGENGSRDCPTVIRDYLIEIMSKEMESWSSVEERKRFSPSELIDSISTAVVEVSGIVPPGAPAGTRFDIRVQAIPGTSTRSLAGGLLLPCELRLADPTMTDEALLGGPVAARAGGPVFVNPFPPAGAEASVDLRHGSVLGGGHTIDERTTRLLLREPSYPAARRLERRINERFSQRPPTAEAMSRGYLNLHTPAEYAARPQDFMQLVAHLYQEGHPAFVEAKLRELAQLVVLPQAECERIGLVWEGIGRTAVPHIQAFYSHENPQVRFYAARAGLRLKDANALPGMADFAGGAQPGLALLAVRELGRCDYPQAATSLIPLLSTSDPELRIAAYEALLIHKHPVIQSHPLASAIDPQQLGLVVDVVESGGSPLIYVRRTRTPRIAIFPGSTPIRLPLFYADADDSVTINAVDGAGDITLFAKRAGRLSERLLVPPRVADLITALADRPVRDDAGRVRGLGLPYSQVVQVLSALCHNETIPARLEIERPTLTEVFGPERSPDRPDTDRPESAEQVADRREGDREPPEPAADRSER